MICCRSRYTVPLPIPKPTLLTIFQILEVLVPGVHRVHRGTVISGFLVDANGNIEYPRIGTIHVEGLTKSELADLIKNALINLSNNLKTPQSSCGF